MVQRFRGRQVLHTLLQPQFSVIFIITAPSQPMALAVVRLLQLLHWFLLFQPQPFHPNQPQLKLFVVERILQLYQLPLPEALALHRISGFRIQQTRM